MIRMMVCTDCGHMGNESRAEYAAPTDIAGKVEFATQMVVKMGFVYVGCPECESPNVFFQDAESENVTSDETVETEYLDVDELEDDDEVIVEEPTPPKSMTVIRKKKKKKKKKSAVAQKAEDLIEDGLAEADDSVVEFKRGKKQPRKRMKKRCRTPDCSNDFETKHTYIDYCQSCLNRFAGK